MANNDNSSGARDDWEALKIVLDSLPSLKQRVLHKLRELRNKKGTGTPKMVKVEKEPEKKKR